jgi:hypothetical protein
MEVGLSKDKRHPTMNPGYQLICLNRQDSKRALPLTRIRVTPVFPHSSDAEIFAPSVYNSLPLAPSVFQIKLFHLRDTSSFTICLEKHLSPEYKFGSDIDRLKAGPFIGVVWNQSPFHECAFYADIGITPAGKPVSGCNRRTRRARVLRSERTCCRAGHRRSVFSDGDNSLRGGLFGHRVLGIRISNPCGCLIQTNPLSGPQSTVAREEVTLVTRPDSSRSAR